MKMRESFAVKIVMLVSLFTAAVSEARDLLISDQAVEICQEEETSCPVRVREEIDDPVWIFRQPVGKFCKETTTPKGIRVSHYPPWEFLVLPGRKFCAIKEKGLKSLSVLQVGDRKEWDRPPLPPVDLPNRSP